MTREEWRNADMGKLRREWGGKCQWPGCERRRGLEFAHKAPTGVCGRGRGMRERYFDVKRNPECYLLLCKGHHGVQELQRQRETWDSAQGEATL